LFVFFFQAEDGIRDFHVTGVQTCALPICFHSLERLQQVLTGENLFQQVVPGSAGLIVGLCRRHARLSRIPSRLHRYFLRAGLFPAWLPSWRASRTHQDESSLSRSVLPLGELTPRYYDLC